MVLVGYSGVHYAQFVLKYMSVHCLDISYGCDIVIPVLVFNCNCILFSTENYFK